MQSPPAQTFRQRSAPFDIDLDAAGFEVDRRTAAVESGWDKALADRLEYLVGNERQRLAGTGEFCRPSARVSSSMPDTLHPPR